MLQAVLCKTSGPDPALRSCEAGDTAFCWLAEGKARAGVLPLQQRCSLLQCTRSRPPPRALQVLTADAAAVSKAVTLVVSAKGLSISNNRGRLYAAGAAGGSLNVKLGEVRPWRAIYQ